MVRITWQLAHTSSHFFSSAIVSVRERLPTISLMFPIFLEPREVIPVHHPHREHFTAIRARHTFFECGHPRARLHQMDSSTGSSRALSTLVVIATVVGTATLTAIGELPGARIMEFAWCFPEAAHYAPPEGDLVRQGWFLLTSVIHRKRPNVPSRLARMSGSRGNLRTPARTSLSRQGSSGGSDP